jgi:glycosyltransferase involved in cell wall biosynthesis
VSLRYVGFLAESSGYGEAARRHLLALWKAGAQVHARSVTLVSASGATDVKPPRAYAGVRRLVRPEETHHTVLVHTPPMHFSSFTDHRRRNIGVTAYEAADLPPTWAVELDAMDALWVPSTFCKEAFERSTRRPVHVVPHPVSPPPPGPVDLPGVPPDVFLFVAIFEWSDRKNPDGLLRAFRDAFRGRSDCALFLKIGCRFEPKQERIARAIREAMALPDAPPVFVTFDVLSPDFLARVMRRADACVSLHRAEGFGLTMAEAMAAGVPVVATGYSGNLEFMDAESAFLVDYRLVPIRERLSRSRMFRRSSFWAEPSHDAAVDALRSCVLLSAERSRKAKRARAWVTEKLDPLRIGTSMRTLLDDEQPSPSGAWASTPGRAGVRPGE